MVTGLFVLAPSPELVLGGVGSARVRDRSAKIPDLPSQGHVAASQRRTSGLLAFVFAQKPGDVCPQRRTGVGGVAQDSGLTPIARKTKR